MPLNYEVVGLIEIDDDADLFWADALDTSFDSVSRVCGLTMTSQDSAVLTNLSQLASELNVEMEILCRQIERARGRTNPSPE